MFRPIRSIALLCATLFLASAVPAQNNTLQIAAAADLEPVLPRIISNFEKTSATHVQVSYASSATLATQILNGAPYDLFLAANRAFPEKIVRANLAVESEPIAYARGSLVLWARGDLSRGPLTMQSLTDSSVRRVAIADPVHAPYGAAASAALKSLGLAAALQPKLVFAENIAQAAQFAESGNAQCALISKTIAITPVMQQAGSFVPVPPGAYPPIEQCAVVLRNAHHQQVALGFLRYLQSAAGATLLGASGLESPARNH